ncbi:MAG: hypothetical protein LBC95_00900 [Candidatus Nomurabacteria bacterium]|jgi:FlaG/FlaF family flagellin (archaellin)|nr:hypothetical protein [Candidatus Nomurabacteria bacterium]
MTKSKKSKARIIVPIIATVLLIATWQIYAHLTGVFSLRWFGDQITVATFQPSPAITDLAEGSGMSDYGRFYFYAAVPEVNDSQDFNINCADVINEESYTLGCYNGRIFLFNVTDERISGVKYVTAAHEMLHVAYDRLGPLEKNRVDELLKKQLSHTTDQRVLDLVEMYAQSEPGQELNELHSIFGSELADLSPELSDYYRRYFADRGKTTSASEKYEAIFADMERRADELEIKMAALDGEIKSMSAQYDADAAALSADVDEFNSLASLSGGFPSEAAFYAQRNSLLYRQSQISGAVDAINAKIDEFNGYVTDLQALGRDAASLQKSIDSKGGLLE